MNLEETERYEVFRSSKIADAKIKKYYNNLLEIFH